MSYFKLLLLLNCLVLLKNKNDFFHPNYYGKILIFFQTFLIGTAVPLSHISDTNGVTLESQCDRNHTVAGVQLWPGSHHDRSSLSNNDMLTFFSNFLLGQLSHCHKFVTLIVWRARIKFTPPLYAVFGQELYETTSILLTRFATPLKKVFSCCFWPRAVLTRFATPLKKVFSRYFWPRAVLTRFATSLKKVFSRCFLAKSCTNHICNTPQEDLFIPPGTNLWPLLNMDRPELNRKWPDLTSSPRGETGTKPFF